MCLFEGEVCFVAAAMGRDLMECLHGLKPVALMVVVQVFFAGVNIFYKLAIYDGMSLRILVAYRYIFATAFLGPLALFLERWCDCFINAISSSTVLCLLWTKLRFLVMFHICFFIWKKVIVLLEIEMVFM